MTRIETKGYLSGSLTDLSPGERPLFLDFYEEVASLAGRYGIDVYLPHKHSDPIKDAELEPGQVHEMNEARVRSATVMIAEITRPSLGVGGEMVVCWRFGTQIILLCQQERLQVLREDPVEGQIFLNPAIQAIISYKDFSDGLRRLEELFVEKADSFKCKVELPLPPSAHDYFTKWAGKTVL